MHIVYIMHTMALCECTMKTFTTTNVRNNIGQFLDTGMVERIQLIRNNRVIGYFLPEKDYIALVQAGKERDKQLQVLSDDQEEAIALYSQGQIGAAEVKSNLGCNYRDLLSILSARNLPLPHIEFDRAAKMVAEAFELRRQPMMDRPSGLRS